MPTEPLQCPFCSTISTRGTGLTAHIRGRHLKEYSKWVEDPNRLQIALNAATSKKAATPRKSSNKSQSAVAGPVICPDCGKAFKSQAALGGHRAYLHKKGPKKAAEPASTRIVAAVSTQSDGKTGTGAAKPRTPAMAKSMAAAPRPTLNGAHEHLRAAHEALVGRDEYIEGELKRLTELQTEKEQVRRELDAVNAALQVFGDNV